MNLSLKEKASYGIGAVGKDMVYILVSSYLMYYYNTVMGLSATFIGVVLMGARIFDAVNDPFMGVVVEKTRTKMGKFRPWLLSGTILNAVVLYALFAVPESMQGHSLMIYMAVAYVLWGVTYTIMDIPYWSMIPAITKAGKDRENLSVIARTCAGLGDAIPTAITMVVVPILGHGSERKGFAMFAGLIAIFFIAAICITVLNVKEKVGEEKPPVSLKEMFQSLFHNDQALIVVASIIIFNASFYITQNLAIYFFKYDIGNAALYGVFGIVAGAAQILSMLLLPVFRKKFECKKILRIAITTSLVGYAILFSLCLTGTTNLGLLCLAAAIVFIGFGLETVLTTIFLADSVDYGEWKHNQRNESVIFSMQTFVVKLASAVSALIAGVSIDLIHLDVTTENAVQSAGTIFGLRFIMSVIPMVGILIAVIFFTKKYKLNDEMLAKITADLNARKGE